MWLKLDGAFAGVRLMQARKLVVACHPDEGISVDRHLGRISRSESSDDTVLPQIVHGDIGRRRPSELLPRDCDGLGGVVVGVEEHHRLILVCKQLAPAQCNAINNVSAAGPCSMVI